MLVKTAVFTLLLELELLFSPFFRVFSKLLIAQNSFLPLLPLFSPQSGTSNHAALPIVTFFFFTLVERTSCKRELSSTCLS